MAVIMPTLPTQETVVGLDVGERFITAAQLADLGGTLQVVNAGWCEVPLEASPEARAAAIRDLWSRNGFGSKTVCACLHHPSMAMRCFHYPALEAESLEAALWLEAEEMLQAGRDDIRMDWHCCPMHNGRTAEGTEGLLVAAPRAVVEGHLRLLRDAGLFPIVFDVAGLALANLYIAVHGAPAEPLCLVNVSTHSADIAILYGDHCIYPRLVYSHTGPWSAALGYLAGNVSDALKYFQFKLRREAVREVVVTGSLAGDETFCTRFAEQLPAPVRTWDPIPDVSRRPWRLQRRFREQPQYGPAMAVALGLAMRS